MFFTHLHPDHIAGAISTDGMAVFENAALQVLESEHNFWTKNNFDPIEVNGADWANLASSVLSAYDHKKEIISIGKDLKNLLKPGWLRIAGIWYPRGGIPIDIFWQTKNIPKGCLVPELNFSPYRGRD